MTSEPARGTRNISALPTGIVVFATLDTKGEYVLFLRDCLSELGMRTIVIDCSLRDGGSWRELADFHASEFADGLDGTRGTAISMEGRIESLTRMATALGRAVSELCGQGKVLGTIGLGGGSNLTLASAAFQSLPIGIPKVLVSTAVSGDVGPVVGGKDVVMVHPVVDFFGLPEPLKASLAWAANAAVLARRMPLWGADDDGLASRTVAATAVGATTPAAEQVVHSLRADLGLESLVFHARGSGGKAFEEVIAAGRVGGCIDLTTTEVANEVVGGLRSAGPDRLKAAVTAGIPTVIVPGAVDIVNFGPFGNVPEEYAGRTFARHAAQSTLMRTSPEENFRIGQWMMDILARTTNRIDVLVPLKGFSSYDVTGTAWFDQSATSALIAGLNSTPADHVIVTTFDQHINDEQFAQTVVQRYDQLRNDQLQTA